MSKLKTNTIRHVDGSNDNITLDSSQNVTVEADLTIPDKIIHSGDTNTTIRFPAADTITAETAGSEKVRVTSTGNLLVGADAVEDWDGSRNHRIQVRGDTYQTAGISILDTQNDDNPCELLLGKSRSTGNSEVHSGDDIGQIRFAANDGNGFHTAAFIRASMEAGTGSDDLPSKLSFATCADGGVTTSVGMILHDDGHVTMGKMPYCKYHPGSDTDSNKSNGTEHDIDGGSATVTNGMACDTSNGRITVPYDGIYHICANIGLLTSDDTHRSRLNLRVNGTDIQRTEHTNKASNNADNTDGGWKTLTVTLTLALSASDYVSFDCVGKHDQQTYTVITVVLLHGN